MKIKLVFQDWQEKGHPIYDFGKESELSKGDFHAGPTFDGTIHLDFCQEKELREAIEKGYQPVFWVYEGG